mmetsp:Transcript_22052/g.50392  ORF Transcript_22052/g.50392 Transcript_22052/m.50392 type:complete len:213 (+) Transcript_22052:234-872(+)
MSCSISSASASVFSPAMHLSISSSVGGEAVGSGQLSSRPGLAPSSKTPTSAQRPARPSGDRGLSVGSPGSWSPPAAAAASTQAPPWRSRDSAVVRQSFSRRTASASASARGASSTASPSIDSSSLRFEPPSRQPSCGCLKSPQISTICRDRGLRAECRPDEPADAGGSDKTGGGSFELREGEPRSSGPWPLPRTAAHIAPQRGRPGAAERAT